VTAVTFPAAPTPARTRRFRGVAGTVAAVVGLYAAVTVRGTGLGGLALAVGIACLVPALWHLAMTPHAYTIDGREVLVHRRWLPDSRFTMRGDPERLSEVEARSGGAAAAAPRDRISRLDRPRVFSALTDVRKGVRVQIGRGGALVISPDDPDAFVRAGRGGGLA
jgi:hypothetical protein